MAGSAGISALAVAVASFPFYDIGAIRGSLAAQGSIFLTSPAAVAVGLRREGMGKAEARRWVAAVGAAVAGGGLAWWALAVGRRPGRRPRAWFEAISLLLLVATWNFRPWYLVWLVALAASLPWGGPARRAIAWGRGGWPATPC